MKFSQLFRSLAVAAGLLAATATQADTVNVSGFLTGAHRWVATNTYVMTNFTYVVSNAVLTIEPGTVVKGVAGSGGSGTGSGANDFGCLFVCRGGKLFAVGTPKKPIIFTAEEDDVNDAEDLPFPTRGRWGGIVLFGNARINNPAFTTAAADYDIYEGLPDSTYASTGEFLHRFGGSNDDDSSGALRYVSIRHGGKLLTTDKEVNGLSLGGVGRGTVIENVETYCIADDGFEFFGGSVNTKYLISAFNDDDAFDTDEGYNGKNQFWFAIQEPGKRDEGSEQNGQPNSPDVIVDDATPLSTYEVYNATFIGAGTTGSGNDALNIRRRNFCRWYNGIFTEFQGKRVDIDATSQPDIRNNIFHNFVGGNGTGYGGAFAPAADNPTDNPLLKRIDRDQLGLLDPRLQDASPAFTGVKETPRDGFYTPTSYKGAFSATDNWMQCWTALAANGHIAANTNEVRLAGILTGAHTWFATNTYILTNFTYVVSNAVLTIEPGTVVKGVAGSGGSGTGSGANDFGCLFVCRGGKLIAAGTAQSPIIFTAEEDDVMDAEDLPFPTRGRWGGIVLFGNARINNPAFTTAAADYDIYEGLPDSTYASTGEFLHRFGGSNDDDSSGVLRYVSIRHGGKLLTTDKEVNGLSLGGVGRGTCIEYVETYCIADDGFEFFGGSVNTKYLISAFNDDDAFDTDEGYNGKNQFWFAIQEPGKRDEGSEQNGQPNSPDVVVDGATPLSAYEVYNATFIGAGTTGSGNDALNIRRHNFCKWYNGIFTEFQGKRVDIDATSQPDIRNNIFFNFVGGNGTGYGGAFAPASVNPDVDPLLNSVSRTQDLGLDPLVDAASPAFTGYRTTPVNGFYSAAPYKGAFGTGKNWAQDWTALSNDCFLTPNANVSQAPGYPELDMTVTSNADGSTATVVWTSVPSLQYKVQSTTDFTAWTDETAWINGTGASVSQNISVPATRKVFRVVAR